MKRRDFILASGSTVLSGLATSQIQRSAIGLDFEISTPDKDPSEVDSLVIEFETLEITPKYLDEKEPVNVQAKVEVANQTKRSNELQTSVINGRTKNLENSIDSIVVDGLNTSSSISGDVTVSIDHPDIQDSYSQQFYVNGSEIPDSAIHRWILDDVDTGTATDLIGSADGSVNGVSNISGTYQGDSAGDGDGTDDVIDTTTLGSFGSTLDTDFAFAFTIDNFTSSDRASPLGSNADLGIEVSNQSSGDIRPFIQDDDGNYLLFNTDSGGHVDDGNKHRVLVNKTANTGSGAMEIYVDNSQVSASAELDQGYSNVSNFSNNFQIFERNDGVRYTPGVMDDVIIYNDSLTSSEISDDYNAQPWS